MENIQSPSQPKKSRLIKVISIAIIVIIGLIILGIALFYFMPIPEAVKEVAKNRDLERCIYSDGIGYYTKSSPGSTIVFFDSKGESLCATGGHGTFFNKPEGPCTQKMCFSIYDK